MPTSPTNITALPVPVPQRSDPVNFAARGDAFLTALPNFATQTNDVADNVFDNATEAFNSATNAATSASNAAGQVTLAAAQVALATTQASNAAASAASAVNAPGSNATSTTSNSVGTGSKTFTIQTGKNFVVGQAVMIARTSAPSTTWMAGNITSHNSGTGSLTVDAVLSLGSGTFTDWTIGLSGPANSRDITKVEDPFVISTNTAAVKFRTYVLTASLVLTLPASPSPGEWVIVSNRSGTVTATVARNAQNIMGLAEDMQINTLNAYFKLMYADATRGWVLI